MEELKNYLKGRINHAAKRVLETEESHGDTPSLTHTYHGGRTLGYWQGMRTAYENILDIIKEGEGVDNLDVAICPKCKSEETYCVNDYLEYALELRKCEDCSCKYEVKYELKVKEIKMKTC